ncbi:glycerophosphodiester phosphodiesterase [Gimesia aquarii]|uniref:Glycerophosphoryl diester phosphodiesterase n=1 Tax=Gimesia aquarii TaxID=2527964 RepID=A0A517WX68_9PLAN|nr:glycerophosphodiester phosphodiesterase family protein [Gimesia aquarii]QDU09792.1 Glycerophosphoryl diester phosphodiesterase [Gimesia aquarii]
MKFQVFFHTAIAFSFLITSQIMMAADPVLIAHRGLLRHAPENTLPAFRACLDLRIGFELDIRTTKDGELVIIHDDSLARTTNGGARSIQNITWADAQQLDAGSWFDPFFSETRIPSLEQTLQLIKARKKDSTIIALNIKQVNFKGEKKLVDLIEKYALFDDCFAFDQSAAMSKRLKQLNPGLRIGQNVNRKSIDARLQENLLDVFLLTYIPEKAEVDHLRKQGKQILFNFAGSGEARQNPVVWNQVRTAGIDGMLTDYPLECRQVWRDVDQDAEK